MIRILDKEEARVKMNLLGEAQIPFLFILDFDFKKCQVYPLESLPKGIHFKCALHQTTLNSKADFLPPRLSIDQADLDHYAKAFDEVKKQLNLGNTFLLNLSFRSLINNHIDLFKLYTQSSASFKLLIEDELLVFSPERFVRILGEEIFTYPMKGTISADVPNAEKVVLNNSKELAEHYTIVDLLRNDLSIVANQVSVEKFRYIDRIQSSKGELLQVSSSIKGKIKKTYQQKLGDLFYALLPAGSVTGAPKKRTVELIKQIEPSQRGYYTGVFGFYDGKNVDSGVMIRCIQKDEKDYYYHSGGGITFMSELAEEFEELNQKIYVPSVRNNTDSRRNNTKSRIPRKEGQSI